MGLLAVLISLMIVSSFPWRSSARPMIETMPSDLEQLKEYLHSGRFTISRLDDGSGAVLDIQTERLFSFNATGLYIVETAAEHAPDEKAIIDGLVARFEVSAASARRDLERFLSDLVRAV